MSSPADRTPAVVVEGALDARRTEGVPTECRAGFTQKLETKLTLRMSF